MMTLEQLNDIFTRRQSCRNFQVRPVERARLTACVEAARLAPSACNSQPWYFVVVDEPARAGQLARCVQDSGMNRFAENCPAFIVVVEAPQNLTARFGGAVKDQKYAGIDLGLATSQLILAAHAQGLGTCILGWFNERKIKILLGIPKVRRVRLVVAVGYAAEDDPSRPKQRKDLADIVCYNRFE